jgi:hypothetical protein
MRFITSAVTLLLLHHAAAFSPVLQQRSSMALFMGKKKQKGPPKLSYAERLQQKREMDREKSSVEAPPPVPSVQEEGSPQQLAKQMVEAQRTSIDMLTFVRQRVECLPLTTIMESLNKDGYVVVDDFLASEDAVSKIQAEGLALFEKEMMETDLTKLGCGEYLASIKGGDDQYLVCPRTIELVVSITKHMPPSLSEFDLDGSNCMAFMRTYDRSSQLASLALVEGAELAAPQPFDIVAKEEDDTRKVTLLYYPIAAEWSDGGITIEKGERLISAKRDRLILLLSDSCRHRPEYFAGDESRERASCLELHLIGKPKNL